MNEEKQVKGLLVILREDERSVLCANKNATNTLVKKRLKNLPIQKIPRFFSYISSWKKK